MKRLTSIFLALAMLLTLVPMSIFVVDADKTAFSDMKKTDYYAQAATALEQLDVLSGYPDGTFGAEKSITRAEMAAIVCRMIDKEADAEKAKGETIFDDVSSDHWASGYINIASKEGIINGDGNGKFRPEDDVKHEEAIKMVVCALGYDADVKADSADWSKGYLEVADKKGISADLKGTKGKASTRGDVAVMSYNGLATESENSKIPATPVASKETGEYKGTQKVKLTTATKDAEIYYTTDGTTPTAKSTKYTKEISISKTSTLKAIAVKNGVVSKGIMSADYTIKKVSSGGGGGGGSYTPPAPTTYTVSFDLNYEGATGAPASQTVNSGDKAIEPAPPTREGYLFVGWYKESECSNVFNFNIEAISSSVVLFAKWEAVVAEIELSVNEDNVFTNNDLEKSYFYAELINYSNNVDSLGLYNDNNELVATMYDDGQYSENGDELSNDNIYTCSLLINKEEEMVLSYIAKIPNVSDIVSNTLEIKVIAAITETQIANMNLVDNAIDEGIFELQNYETMSIEERKEVTEDKLEELEESGLIVENTIIYDENSSTYTFEYESGALGAVMIGNWDENQNGIRYSRESLNENEISVFSAVNKATEIAENDEIQVMSASSFSDLNAIILWSFNQAWDNDNYRRPFYQSTEADWESDGVDTDVIWDTTVEDYKNLDDYEIIVFSGHGAYTSYKPSTFAEMKYMSSLLLHEKATQEKDDLYKNDLKLYNIGKIKVNGGTMYAILPNFWTHYYKEGDLDGSFIFAENCEFHGKNGTVHKDMSNALTSLSAEAVIGFHNSVMADYSRELMKEYIDGLIDGGLSSTAFNNAKTMHGENDYFTGRENYGPTAYPILDGNLSAMLISTNFENGDFEASNPLSGWKKQGDVRAISKLGELSSKHGDKMAILTTGIGSGESAYGEATEGSLLYQTFKVPSDAKTLSFVYNVVSEEPMEYVGSQFDDKFKVEIRHDNSSYQILQESVNMAVWSTVEGINFDGGDETAYQTGWKTINYDISDYQNKTITLRFVVYDVGDSIYDTATLIDNVFISDDVLYEEKPFKYTQKAVTDIVRYVDDDYDEFYYNSQLGAIVPGLSEDFVPQGIAYRADKSQYYISGYINGGNSNSVIMVIDALTNKYVGEYYLNKKDTSAFTGHAGGIAITANNLFVANGKSLSRISLDKIDLLDGYGDLFFEEDIKLAIGDAGISFCNYSNGILWIGNFWESLEYNDNAYGTHKALALGYQLDETTGTFKETSKVSGESFAYLPDYICKIPEKIQGITVCNGNMLLSQSYGKKNKSSLLIGEDPTIICASDDIVTIGGEIIPVLEFTAEYNVTAMPMMEGIAAIGNQVVTLFESGAKKYKDDGGKDPIDRLWLFYGHN